MDGPPLKDTDRLAVRPIELSSDLLLASTRTNKTGMELPASIERLAGKNTLTPAITLNVRSTAVAGFHAVFPGWVARMVQAPSAPCKVTFVPVTVHTLGVSDENPTVRVEVASADTANGAAPMSLSARALKLIVWGARTGAQVLWPATVVVVPGGHGLAELAPGVST